jgi:hypothetical protein
MKATRFSAIVFGMLLGGAHLVHAQTSSPAPAATSTPPSLSQLNVSTMLKQLQTAAAEGEADAPSPLEIVVQFLELQPAQQAVFGQLLEARQTAVTPLFAAIAAREQQVRALLDSGGNPAEVGILVTQIYALQHQIVETQQTFLAKLLNLLDQDQKQRLAAVQSAAQLQPVLPAFLQLQLF